MADQSVSWLRSTLNHFFLYLVAGACFIPSGFLYGLAVVHNWKQSWVAGVSLTFGFVAASLAWTILEKRLKPPDLRPFYFPPQASTGPENLATLHLYDAEEKTKVGSHCVILSFADRPTIPGQSTLQPTAECVFALRIAGDANVTQTIMNLAA